MVTLFPVSELVFFAHPLFPYFLGKKACLNSKLNLRYDRFWISVIFSNYVRDFLVVTNVLFCHPIQNFNSFSVFFQYFIKLPSCGLGYSLKENTFLQVSGKMISFWRPCKCIMG